MLDLRKRLKDVWEIVSKQSLNMGRNDMRVQRENPEWVNYWWDIADDKTIKRWLLVGDSVARQLRGAFQSLIPEQVSVDYLGMSFSLLDDGFGQEIEHFFSYKEYSYDLVIMNGGFHHGFGVRCSQSKNIFREYEEKYAQIIDILSEKCANIILMSGTPEVKAGELTSFNDDINEEIKIRNEIAKKISIKKDYRFIDLYNYIMKNRTSFSYVDRFHFDRTADYNLANEIIENIYGFQQGSYKNISLRPEQRISNARVFEHLLKEKPVVLYGIGKNARQLYKYINDRGGNVPFAMVSDGEATQSDFFPKVLSFSEVDFVEQNWTLLVTVKKSYDIEKCLSDNAKPYIVLDDSLMEFIVKYNEAFCYDV